MFDLTSQLASQRLRQQLCLRGLGYNYMGCLLSKRLTFTKTTKSILGYGLKVILFSAAFFTILVGWHMQFGFFFKATTDLHNNYNTLWS